VLLAEQRRQHVVGGVAKLGLHLLPLADHTLLDGTAHVPRLLAVFEVTLDATTFDLQATATPELLAELGQLAADLRLELVSEPNLRGPVDTDRMGPDFGCRTRGEAQLLDDAFGVGTQSTKHLIDGFVVHSVVEAAVTVPGLVGQRQSVEDLGSVAGLVRSCKAKFTDHDLVTFPVVGLQADVAHDAVVVFVLGGLDRGEGVHSRGGRSSDICWKWLDLLDVELGHLTDRLWFLGLTPGCHKPSFLSDDLLLFRLCDDFCGRCRFRLTELVCSGGTGGNDRLGWKLVGLVWWHVDGGGRWVDGGLV
jgi:hypothetical protein